MKITSPAFGNEEKIPAKHTCDGENVSPPLAFANVPGGTKSLALIVEDPDAPGGLFVHWTVWNINPNLRTIQEGGEPRESVLGKNDFHRNTYGGPCPPGGTHRYFFKLFALDRILNLPGGAGKSQLEEAMEGHIIAQAQLVGLYR